MAAEGPGVVQPGIESALEDPAIYKEATVETLSASLRRSVAGAGEIAAQN